MRALLLVPCLVACTSSSEVRNEVVEVAHLDLATTPVLRVYNSGGSGERGVPVAGARDCDGDGHADLAIASILASPLERAGAGSLFLVFGSGDIAGSIDTGEAQSGVLRIHGAASGETAGNEITLADVTGDGLGDILIGRQNFTPEPGQEGAGALSILIGGDWLRDLAGRGQALDLAAPPPEAQIATVVGRERLGRLGIWMRTGDVSGDGIEDIIVGADQERGPTAEHRGAAYVVRGGAHLSAGTTRLGRLGATALAGHVARLEPDSDEAELHFGATVQIADVDGDGLGDLLAAGALVRAGAGLPASAETAKSAHAEGGARNGTLFLLSGSALSEEAWSDEAATLMTGRIDGSEPNVAFGEELLGGFDLNGDGELDLFAGDITSSGIEGLRRPGAGSGHILFSSQNLLVGRTNLDELAAAGRVTHLVGAHVGDIAGDTATWGDFDADGRPDLVVAAPHAAALGRSEAGVAHVLWGNTEPWTAVLDLSLAMTTSSPTRLAILGAHGNRSNDRGDILGYSAASGDVNGDGIDDLILNEMLGNGPGRVDQGALIVIDGRTLATAREESAP